jgi:hypothetical protein
MRIFATPRRGKNPHFLIPLNDKRLKKYSLLRDLRAASPPSNHAKVNIWADS